MVLRLGTLSSKWHIETFESPLQATNVLQVAAQALRDGITSQLRRDGVVLGHLTSDIRAKTLPMAPWGDQKACVLHRSPLRSSHRMATQT